MYKIKFTCRGQRDFKKLHRNIQQFVRDKLIFYSSQNNPLHFAKPLTDLPPSTHRFRIRKYRASFFLSGKTIFIERIQLRGQAYRR